MNNILAYVLGALLLLALYTWYNGKTLRNEMTEEASEFLQKVSGKAKNLTNTAKDKLSGFFDDESTDREASSSASPLMVEQQVPTSGAISIPMEDAHMGSYPSGILPGKVGTFHPTDQCGRFNCNDCMPCETSPDCAMTDDRNRNYPALIDAIRKSKTNEYQYYNNLN